jgi:hypothetical protein
VTFAHKYQPNQLFELEFGATGSNRIQYNLIEINTIEEPREHNGFG